MLNPLTNAHDEIESYNINGKTIIKFDELSRYGNVSWDGNSRTLSLTTN